MAKRGDKATNTIGSAVFFVIVLVILVPKEVWFLLGGVVTLAVLGAIIWKWNASIKERRAAELEWERAERAAEAAEQEREQARQARAHELERVELFGEKNVLLVDSAQSAARQVAASEAAREGWLGDVDFTADIAALTDKFHKAHALRKVAGDLSALDDPSVDDQSILAEAQTTAAALERAAVDRVTLIKKCAEEAARIDETLHAERMEARTAEQRAQLHGQLSAMLYGIQAAPDSAPADTAAHAVMARVEAYREIQHQIVRARDN